MKPLLKLDLKAPHQTYRAANGDRLVGVTTYTGRLPKDELMPWYARMERDGIMALIEQLAADGATSARDLLTTIKGALPTRPKTGKPQWFAEASRDKAANLGTITHERVRAWLAGTELDTEGLPADLYAKSQHGLDRFKRWWESEGFTLEHSERQVIFDDGVMRYGGTIDIVAVDRHAKRALVDLKTSKASDWWPYPPVFAQVAAYAKANPERIDRIVVVRIGTVEGDETQVYELSEREWRAGWRLFCSAYQTHEGLRELENARA